MMYVCMCGPYEGPQGLRCEFLKIWLCLMIENDLKKGI